MAFTEEDRNQGLLHDMFINLYHIALIDHELREEEIEFLYQLGERHQFSRAQVRDVLNEARQASFKMPRNKEQKVEILFNMVNMMIVDGRLDEREAHLCTHLATEIGFKPEQINEVLKTIITSADEHLSETEIKQEVIQFLQ